MLRALALPVMLLFMGLPAASHAQATLYDCSLTRGAESGSWVSPRIVIIVHDGTRAQILDEVSVGFDRAPVEARVRAAGNQLRITWRLSNLMDSADNRIPTFRFQALLSQSSGSVELKASPVGVPQSWRGQGRCVTRENVNPRDLSRILRG